MLSPRRNAGPATQEAPTLPLPDKPSIVVLPFVNMSQAAVRITDERRNAVLFEHGNEPLDCGNFGLVETT